MSFILKGKCKSIETILYFQKTAISFLFLCFIFAKKNTFLFTFIIIVININTNQCLKCEVFLLGYCRWEINPNGTLRVESCKPLVYTNEWITSKVTDASRMALIQNRLVSLCWFPSPLQVMAVLPSFYQKLLIIQLDCWYSPPGTD